eukprot:6192706-Pleurochrysis_carterae.AAC.2
MNFGDEARKTRPIAIVGPCDHSHIQKLTSIHIHDEHQLSRVQYKRRRRVDYILGAQQFVQPSAVRKCECRAASKSCIAQIEYQSNGLGRGSQRRLQR